MAALQASGYDIYVPFGENTRCDLVVDNGQDLLRLQCKTGRLREGAVLFAVCSCYGHHRNPQTARRSYAGEVDYFAVYCRDTTEVYLVPVDAVPTGTQAHLRVLPARNNQRRGVRLASDFVVGRVTIEGLRVSSGA